MLVRHLWLGDFRSYTSAEVVLGDGLTAVLGDNGEGKTNLVEALAYLATLDSFRSAPPDALIRVGADTAVVRAEIVHTDGRELLVEAELVRSGRNRVMVNKQRLARARDLLGVLRVTVFSPDDLVLVKGAPAERRRYLDDLLVAIHPKHDKLRTDLERILRQRVTLLKQAGGRLTDDVAFTLDVWDAKLAETGTALGDARADLVADLAPRVADAYADVAGRPVPVAMRYEPAWRSDGLAAALVAGRSDDVRRQANTVGPHRDELDLALTGLPARTHASQGEQRSLALALRLAGHRLVAEQIGETPLLVLDDVFSELDPERSAALLAHLPAGQVLLTSASGLPPGAAPGHVVHVAAGMVVP